MIGLGLGHDRCRKKVTHPKRSLLHNPSLSNKVCYLNSFWVGLLNGRKTTKNDFNWKVNISKRTAVNASKFSVTLSLDLSNSSSEFGISTLFYSEMLKVRKRTKNDINWKVNMSKSTALGHPKFVWHFDLNLATCSQSLKFEQVMVWKCLKLEKQSNLTFIISKNATARASKFCEVLCLKLRRTLWKFGVWATRNSEMLKVREVVNMTLING